jgi:RimJ/RimL family protein N-acetyltransferase
MFALKTERLLLRHFDLADSESLMYVFGDADVMHFGDGVQTREWVDNWLQDALESYQTRGLGPYAVVEQSSGEVIGYCGLFYCPDVNGRPEIEIGYRLRRSAWGQGYATEAVLAVRDFAFKALNIRHLIAMIDPSNTASIRVAEKVGMRYESDVMFEGYSYPDHVYGIENGNMSL